MKQKYFVEVTDTFGGELNYSWVRRYMVTANSMLGAVQKLSRHTGYSFRKNFSDGESARYDAKNACIGAYLTWSDGSEAETYKVETI